MCCKVPPLQVCYHREGRDRSCMMHQAIIKQQQTGSRPRAVRFQLCESNGALLQQRHCSSIVVLLVDWRIAGPCTAVRRIVTKTAGGNTKRRKQVEAASVGNRYGWAIPTSMRGGGYATRPRPIIPTNPSCCWGGSCHQALGMRGRQHRCCVSCSAQQQQAVTTAGKCLYKIRKVSVQISFLFPLDSSSRLPCSRSGVIEDNGT